MGFEQLVRLSDGHHGYESLDDITYDAYLYKKYDIAIDMLNKRLPAIKQEPKII